MKVVTRDNLICLDDFKIDSGKYVGTRLGDYFDDVEVDAIPLDKVKQAIEKIANKYDDLANAWCEREEGRNEAILEVLEILDKLIAESEVDNG